MTAGIRRGYVPDDERQFSPDNIILLQKAQDEILYLLEHGYPMKSVSTFVGNHYLLSERQRLAVVRATAPREVINKRLLKRLPAPEVGSTVFIDGLNIIITLEVALSGSTLIRCMDETIRDLAGLRGTYRIIDKTDNAINLIGRKLAGIKAAKAVFYLDKPVSNTGRLKSSILKLLDGYPFSVSVELVNNPDVLLENLSHVVTSDAIILDKCMSYYNLAAEIIEENLPGTAIVDLSRSYIDPAGNGDYAVAIT